MSKAITCDHCGETLVLNDQGEDENGEVTAWLEIRAGGIVYGRPQFRFDACTRSCAHRLLDNGELAKALDDWTEQVAEVTRALRDTDGQEGDQ